MTAMSLDLDDRQRAMLLEMGVHVWWPKPQAPVLAESFAPVQAFVPPRGVEAASRAAPANQNATEIIAAFPLSTKAMAPSIVNASTPTSERSTPASRADDVAAMDWATLTRTVGSCQACKLCTGRQAPVFAPGDTPRQADWLVVGEPPDEAEERQGAAFAAQAGQLLDNMLKAVGVSRHAATSATAGADAASPATAAYVTNVVKCRPGTVRNPEPQELATCENYLRREVALVQPKVILAMGRFAAQTLLRDCLPEVASIPLGKLRGQVYRYHGIPVVVSYHPSYLLRTQQDKARAWADLCLALVQSKKEK